MSHRIDVVRKLTAVTADFLAGESLDPMPGAGYLRIYASSIVDTNRISITPSLHASPTGGVAQTVPEGAGADSGAAPNHPVIISNMPHWETEVSKGEKVVIEISGTTTEIMVWVTFLAGGR